MRKMTAWRLALAAFAFTAAGCAEHATTSETTSPVAAAPATVAADSTAAPAAQGVAIAYTCPMHPAVVSAQPGKCPKCGMDLVAKK